MTLYDAINSGKPYKRKRNKVWIDPDNDSSFAMRDVIATDWEIKEDPPTLIKFEDRFGNKYHVNVEGRGIFIANEDDDSDFAYIGLLEDNIDKILTFLYHNSDIGKKRIIPF